ncbi:MAG TPA: ABC transporter permease [Kofleriaceae bacterium]|jgi:simple sugar transport system permease protein|nr:ABC transporter permease [Kofleriaceae bacterium]
MKREALTIGFAVLVAALAGSVLIWSIGQSPLEVYGLLLERTWGSSYGIGQVLFKTTPLILTGLAVSVAFKVGLFNIGAEGQLAAGSFVTAICGATLPESLPGPIAVALCVLAGMLAGAGLAGLAGVLKTRYGAHEVINTIMLNFIISAVLLWAGNAQFFVHYTTHTRTISDNASLHDLGITGSAANTSLLLALGLAAAVAYFFSRTRRGFEWRAVGHNPRAAQNGGVQLAGVVIGAMATSGSLAGAVGANYVLGYKHYYEQGIGSGDGFMGIAVALLGRNHPAGIVVAALLMGTLSHGGLGVADLVPKELVKILQAIIILTVAGAAAYRGRAVKNAKAAGPVKRLHDPDAERDAAEREHG